MRGEKLFSEIANAEATLHSRSMIRTSTSRSRFSSTPVPSTISFRYSSTCPAHSECMFARNCASVSHVFPEHGIWPCGFQCVPVWPPEGEARLPHRRAALPPISVARRGAERRGARSATHLARGARPPTPCPCGARGMPCGAAGSATQPPRENRCLGRPVVQGARPRLVFVVSPPCAM